MSAGRNWAILGSLLATGCFSIAARPQVPPAAPMFKVVFQFDRPVAGVSVPHYTIELRGDGTGVYHAEMPAATSAGGGAASDSAQGDAQKIERPLIFAADTVLGVVAAIETLRSAGIPCASKAKNIADTGTKTLTFHTAAGEGTCTYNYTESKAAVQLTTLFQGIESTLEEGRALDFKHRFDRLGLDAEMASLASAVEEGRALELGNIAPTLRSISADTELIQRVRLRAAKLLERAQGSG